MDISKDTSFSMHEKCSIAKVNQRYIPKRYIVTLLGMLGLFNVYTMRVNLNVALVAMVNSTTSDAKNNISVSTECSLASAVEDNTGPNVEKNWKGGQYDWDAKTRGNIKGSFFYGYFITVLTGGYLAERFGAKRMFGGGVMITAVLTLLTPLAVWWGLAPFLAIRAVEGVGEGLTFPAINSLISRWAPKLERSRISSAIFIGSPIGTVVSLSVSGWLCNSDVIGGWPSVFYVFGAIACAWLVFWIIFVKESPLEHPGISAEEMSLYDHVGENQLSHKRPRILWMKIVTSLPMWSVLISHIGMYFGFSVLLIDLPTYLTSVHHLGIETSGLLIGLPNLLEVVGGLMASFVADKLISSKRLSITTVRKIFNSIASYGAGLCLLGIPWSGCNSTSVIVLFSLFMTISGFKYSGFNVNHVDMCPPIAGTLYGLTNGIACLSGIVAPLMVGSFTANGDTLANWGKVFYVTAGVYFASATFYALFASAEPQPWIGTSTEDTTSAEKTEL